MKFFGRALDEDELVAWMDRSTSIASGLAHFRRAAFITAVKIFQDLVTAPELQGFPDHKSLVIKNAQPTPRSESCMKAMQLLFSYNYLRECEYVSDSDWPQFGVLLNAQVGAEHFHETIDRLNHYREENLDHIDVQKKYCFDLADEILGGNAHPEMALALTFTLRPLLLATQMVISRAFGDEKRFQEVFGKLEEDRAEHS